MIPAEEKMLRLLSMLHSLSHRIREITSGRIPSVLFFLKMW